MYVSIADLRRLWGSDVHSAATVGLASLIAAAAPLRCATRSCTRRRTDHDPGGVMSNYTVVRLEEIDELDDGRCPMRPVRHVLGASSFGLNAWTGRAVGDRIINEHDEEGE